MAIHVDMKMLLVCAVLLAGGCANGYVNRGALIASTAALVCDGMQTMKTANGGWSGSYERNPIMGPAPDGLTVGVYFASAVVFNAFAWAVTPAKYRAALPTTIAAVQTRTVLRNISHGTGLCGF